MRPLLLVVLPIVFLLVTGILGTTALQRERANATIRALKSKGCRRRRERTRARASRPYPVPHRPRATRIMLYGFAPDRVGIFWTEVGVRSDVDKNLEGKCRQANFGGPKEQPHA